jgi:aminopeptidase
MIMDEFDTKLARYADLTLGIGLNLQPGQRLQIRTPLLSAPFTRLVTQRAYQLGAQFVDVLWQDEQLQLIRHQYAPRGTFEEFPVYQAEGRIKNVKDGGAALYISGEDPDLLSDQNPDDLATVEKTFMKHMKEFYDLLGDNFFNWLIVSYPTPAWAKKVFPEVSAQKREEQLWEAIFQVCRINESDPTAAWQVHIANLKTRSKYMTEKQYTALQFRGPGTDLTIGLAERHRWDGGGETTRGGIFFTPNLPTEEIFSLPHRERIDGHVSASMPLSRSGALVEDFSVHFEHGRVTQVEASNGKETLEKLIAIDEGMGSLGEVALVPYSSPISKLGILFYNTLLDENAASHIALGDGFKFCMQDAEKMSDEDYAARGGNSSLNHIDFMIGNSQMDVDGINADGTREPVMRTGEWAFDV